ncbi:MAG: hypothetical protein GQE15_07635 [Archangiaceae bacterium]|nr:hypothetical protein [Archangiaceae bacterium]
MLYERARQLKSGGASSAEIRRALLAEGASEEDVQVVLGSLGDGPQPQPDPTQKPLDLMSRVANSRGLRAVAFVMGAVVVAAMVYAVWVGGVFVMGLVSAFRAGR